MHRRHLHTCLQPYLPACLPACQHMAEVYIMQPHDAFTLNLHAQASSLLLTASPAAAARMNANLGNSTLLNRLRPLAPGTATVTGSFGGRTATLPMTLASTIVTFDSVALSATWCSSNSTDPQCSVTFAGIQNTTAVLEVGLQNAIAVLTMQNGISSESSCPDSVARLLHISAALLPVLCLRKAHAPLMRINLTQAEASAAAA